MEGTIPGLFLFHLVILTPPCVANSTLNVSKVVRTSYLMSWMTAQTFCRKYYTDLVTIRNEEENNKLNKSKGWIGLNMRNNNTWTWSRGTEEPSFINWDINEPDLRKWCALKYSSSLKWQSNYCYELHPFLCMDKRLVLVQEMKTWEEALKHCRQLYTHTRFLYDLASLPEQHEIPLYAETREVLPTTNEVWIGLRFLAGKWVWLSNARVTSSYLPQCPAQQQHCGTLVLNSTEWKIMNCSEKRHFLCGVK